MLNVRRADEARPLYEAELELIYLHFAFWGQSGLKCGWRLFSCLFF